MGGIGKLGIDFYGILIYMVNTGLIIGVLTYLLYKPVLRVLDKRKKHISDQIGEAELIKSEFEKKLKEMQLAKEEAAAELQAKLDEMNRYVNETRRKLTEEMETEREAMLKKAATEIDARKESLIKEVEGELLKLISKIVLHIVHNRVPENVIEESVKDAWKTYKS